jgi:hypothetical protein
MGIGNLMAAVSWPIAEVLGTVTRNPALLLGRSPRELERFSDALHAPRLSPPLPLLRKGGKLAASGLFPPLRRGDTGGFFECLCVAPGSASRRLKTALEPGQLASLVVFRHGAPDEFILTRTVVNGVWHESAI